MSISYVPFTSGGGPSSSLQFSPRLPHPVCGETRATPHSCFLTPVAPTTLLHFLGLAPASSCPVGSHQRPSSAVCRGSGLLSALLPLLSYRGRVLVPAVCTAVGGSGGEGGSSGRRGRGSDGVFSERRLLSSRSVTGSAKVTPRTPARGTVDPLPSATPVNR